MKKINKKIAVIMCVWSRFNLLEKTLDMLESQTDKNFDFFIWNNNSKVKEVKDLFNENKYSFNIETKTYHQNIGGIGRFYYAHYISNQYDYVIFIDDDQEFDKNLIKTFKEEANPQTISGWWAYKIWGEYNQRTRSQPYQEADYVGTGGMICPTSIFQDFKLFETLPREYIFVEDLWLSYFAKYEHNYKLQSSNVNINFIPNENIRDQHYRLGKTKIDFHRFLKRKYNI